MSDAATFRRDFLSVESLLVGGLSIFIWWGCWAFADPKSSTSTVATFAFFLSFVINFPHFIASYFLLYEGFQARVRSGLTYPLVAITLPFLMLFTFTWSVMKHHPEMLAHAAMLMHFLVGWHYAKQTYGCLIVLSLRRGYAFSLQERRLLRLMFHSFWVARWCGRQAQSGEIRYLPGLGYPALELPVEWSWAIFTLAALSALAMGYFIVRRFLIKGELPAASGLWACLALLFWQVRGLEHPLFFVLVPMLHSLQYLVIAGRYKFQQVQAQAAELAPRAQRLRWVRGFWGFAGACIWMGALLFYVIPMALDRAQLLDSAWAANSFLLMFTIFLNVHHFFIDAIIWRTRDPEVQRHLLLPQLREVA